MPQRGTQELPSRTFQIYARPLPYVCPFVSTMTNNCWFPEDTALPHLHAFEMRLLCPGNVHPSLSSLLSASHYLRYSSGRYPLLRGAFPECRLRPCPPLFIPSEHRLHCFVAANRFFCLPGNIALTPRHEGALPSSQPPNLGLVLEIPLPWLSSGSAPSP